MQKSYEGLLSADYLNDGRIKARPPNDQDTKEKIANIERSMALFHLKENNFVEAEQLLYKAMATYKETGNVSGLGNTFRTRAMLKRSRGGLEYYSEAALWLHAAQRKFESIDDQFAVEECQNLIDGSTDIIIRE